MTTPFEPASAAAQPKPRLRDVLASRKMLLLLAFGAASGFPNQVTESALQAWGRFRMPSCVL